MSSLTRHRGKRTNEFLNNLFSSEQDDEEIGRPPAVAHPVVTSVHSNATAEVDLLVASLTPTMTGYSVNNSHGTTSLNLSSRLKVTEEQGIGKPERIVFDTSRATAKMLINWTILLTFGIASPLLAIAVAADTCAMILLWRLLFRRMLESCTSVLESAEKPTVEHLLVLLAPIQKLEEASVFTIQGIKVAMAIVVIVCSWFWSLFIFDMIGDVNGFRSGGYAVLTFIFIVPIILWVNDFFLLRLHERNYPLRICNLYGHWGTEPALTANEDPLRSSTLQDSLVDPGR
jgi:hypothetical protein